MVLDFVVVKVASSSETGEGVEEEEEVRTEE